MKVKSATHWRITLVTLLLPCFAMLVGCMSTRMGTDFNSANISQIKVGVTTEREVYECVGLPRSKTRNSDGIVTLHYFYAPGRTYGPLAGLNPNLSQEIAADSAKNKSLTVILDANGKVKSFTEDGSQNGFPNGLQ